MKKVVIRLKIEPFSEMLKKKNRKFYPLILNRMGTIAIFMAIWIDKQI